MIRAVLDTNVYVAALLSRDGSPARIIRALGDGLLDAVVCPRLLAELRGVLARPKIAERVDVARAEDFVQWLDRVATTVPHPGVIAQVSPDPDDDYLIALALIGRAEVIVSGDAHLLGLTSTSPRTLSPATFADLVDGLR
ncbi:MAG: putative toxin-antitoxin system toxin component, PIN family [Coriobacteriia bacterium]|nr:putative toxin-antitoxin system toxin component, PIN family [Coriobacteriia bacterium]